MLLVDPKVSLPREMEMHNYKRANRGVQPGGAIAGPILGCRFFCRADTVCAAKLCACPWVRRVYGNC